MATKNQTAVATQSANPFATALPEYIKQDSARGSEQVKTSDLILPRLEIVQALSPIKEENPEAREGMLFNSVTGDIYGDHVYFVPIYFRTEFLVWKDQNEGGGFFGSFPTLNEAQSRVAEAVDSGEDEDLLEIVDTPVHFGLRITPDLSTCEQLVISMAKTKAKISRKWNAMIQIAGGDRFARVYKISAFTDENKKGQKFKNYVVQAAGFTPEPVYRQAEKLYEVFKTQAFEAAHDSGNARSVANARGEI